MGVTAMNLDAAIKELHQNATKKKADVAKKRGTSEVTVIGTSTAVIRKLAKRIAIDDQLAAELWSSRFHEAHLLATFIASFSDTSQNYLDSWVSKISSWGTCDQLAKRLAPELPDLLPVAKTWIHSEPLYVRRAGLALIANYCMKSHELTDVEADSFCELVKYAAADDRQHIRQATCWALRELGKIDDSRHNQAIQIALELQEIQTGANSWVGRCAYKELESLMKIPDRRRLISRNSKTAQKYL